MAGGADLLNSPEVTRLLAAFNQIEGAEYNEPGSYAATLKLITYGKKRDDRVYQVETKGDHKFIHITEAGDVSIYARSPSYVFVIKRRKGKSAWVLVRFLPDSGKAAGAQFEEPLLGVFGLGVLYPLGVDSSNAKSSECLKKYQDSLVSVRVDPTPGGSVLHYSYDSGMLGEITTDAARGGVITKSTTTFAKKPSPRDETFTREFVPDAKRPGSQLPVCKSITFISKDEATKKIQTDFKMEFSDYSSAVPGDEIFRLSHYGLPEPARVSWTQALPTYLWLIIVAVGLLFAALLLYRRSRREPNANGS